MRSSAERLAPRLAIRLLLEALGVLFLDGDVAQTLLQCGDLAEPLHAAGFVEPFVSV
ncbi:hypothetical protein [Frankia sp. AgB32]|uniref:hypothetical protein n=1 Tax=Frankia sp. AgB32 TaxID=631119 RepID=UPI00200CB18D|nr:hypothetical protein [Frankia sp. AgB32]MCK9898415.1 hypothetical protein [Frankia sp. AgB32]